MEQKIFDAAEKAVTPSKAQKTTDGFRNVAMKLGIAAPGDEGSEDNLLSAGHYLFNLLTRNRIQLEAAYRGSWVVGKSVDCVAEDMTRAGVTITTNDGAEKLQDFKAQMSRLQIWSCIKDATAWGRLYGGCIGVFQIDGQDMATPLDPETIDKDQFLGIAVYDRWQLNPVLQNVIPSGPDIGLPAYYDIVLGSNLNDPGQVPGGSDTTTQASGRVRVHHSRCFRMGGFKLPFFQAITEMMWEESIVERLWDRLIEFDTTNSATAGLVGRANLRTVGIDNLREILAAGGEEEEALIEQFEYMRKFQMNEGITLLDKLDTFMSTAYSFAGLSDVMLQFAQQVSAAVEIPLTRFFGQSPAGLNSTGEGDMRNYYEMINAKQEAKLRNPVELIIKILWRSTFGESIPKDLTFVFTSLYQLDPIQKSTVAQNNTNSIISAHEGGLVSTPTAMKELKKSSGDNGLFTHITDEDIDEAESEGPPLPELENPTAPNQEPGNPGEGPATPQKKPTGDSFWKKLKLWSKPQPTAVKIIPPVKRSYTKDQKAIRRYIKK